MSKEPIHPNYEPLAPTVTFVELVNQAEASLQSIIDVEASYSLSLEKAAYKVIEHIVAVHKAGKDEATAYSAFLDERGVGITNRTINPLHPTTAALVPRSQRRHYRQRITQYAQVAFVLIEHSVEDIGGWFAQPEKVGSRTLTGLSKATALYKALPHVVAHNQTRRPSVSKDVKSGATAGSDCQEATPAVAVGYLDATGCFVPTATNVAPSTVEAVSRLMGEASTVAGNENATLEQTA